MRGNRTALLSLLIVGGYFAFKNRFKIQQFLESRGIDTKLDTSSVTNALKSGVARIRGQAEREVKSA